jgi:molybdopterin converting factor small subunit
VAVTFQLSGALRPYAGNRDRVDVPGSPATVKDALEALWAVCPGLRDRVTTEQGQIREHVNVFVGQDNIKYTGGLATPVSPGDEISIFNAVSGG